MEYCIGDNYFTFLFNNLIQFQQHLLTKTIRTGQEELEKQIIICVRFWN